MEDEELDKKDIEFKEEISKLWNDGLITKTYTDAIELARKHGYIIPRPMPCTAYAIYTDVAHSDYRVDLYSSSNKHLMQLIFKESKSKKLPFRLKTFHLFKQ